MAAIGPRGFLIGQWEEMGSIRVLRAQEVTGETSESDASATQ